MQIKYRRLSLLMLLCCGLASYFVIGRTAPRVDAHGTSISYKIEAKIDIEALFDTGEPMANANIAVYAPSDPETPWLQGQADEFGRFSFAPDPTMIGTWDVSVRTAGHGEIVHIPLTTETTGGLALVGGGVGGGGQTTAQRILMGGSILWGFVGTALYFSGRRSLDKRDVENEQRREEN